MLVAFFWVARPVRIRWGLFMYLMLEYRRAAKLYGFVELALAHEYISFIPHSEDAIDC